MGAREVQVVKSTLWRRIPPPVVRKCVGSPAYRAIGQLQRVGVGRLALIAQILCIQLTAPCQESASGAAKAARQRGVRAALPLHDGRRSGAATRPPIRVAVAGSLDDPCSAGIERGRCACPGRWGRCAPNRRSDVNRANNDTLSARAGSHEAGAATPPRGTANALARSRPPASRSRAISNRSVGLGTATWQLLLLLPATRIIQILLRRHVTCWR
jgi:hypothetical protein